MRDKLISIVVERKVPIFKKHPYYFWATCFVIAIAGSFFFAKDLSNPRSYLGLCILHSVGFLTVPLAFMFCYRIFLKWSKTIENFLVPDIPNTILNWFRQELRFFEGCSVMYFTGICLGILAVLGFYSESYLINYPLPSTIYCYLIIFATAFLAGIGLYAMCCASRVIWRIGKLQDMNIRVEKHKFGILSTGIVLVKCWFIIVVVWCFFAMSAIFGFQTISMKIWLTSMTVWILAAPTLPLIIGSFLVCQIPLHNRMVEYKRKEIQRIETLQEELVIHKSDGLTEEYRAKIEFLERQKALFSGLPEWPFSVITLISISASSFMPIFIALLSTVTAEAMKSYFKW